MSKEIISSNNLKKIALDTITAIAAVVKATLGPGGNPIIIDRSGTNPDGSPRTPLITKDGVTVAESISFKKTSMNMIAKAVIQVAKDTVNAAGDGTTSSLVLAEAIYKAGYKYIDQGKNSIKLYEELKEIKNEVLAYVDANKTEVGLEDVYRVAEISSNGDQVIARVVKEAIDQVGEDGHITLEEGSSRDTVLDVVEGAMYKQGYRTFGNLGSLMVTDKGRDVCELRDPAVLLYNGKLDSMHELGEFIGNVYKADGNKIDNPFPLLIVANDFSEEVKNMILANRKQAGLPIAAIKTPFDGSPNARTGILEDLAVLTGAEVASRGLLDLKDVTLDHLGGADKIEMGSYETVIFGGKGDENEVLGRVDELKKLIENSPHQFDKDNVRIRIGKLTGGIAVIRVGGDSELEILEKKDRIEDALCAAKVAIQDGIVPGGGTLLYKWALSKESVENKSPALEIMISALQAPIRQLILNVGEVPDQILAEMKHSKMEGYNARTKKLVVSMIEEGIIDPAKVTKSALENAVSIAGLLLTTGGAVCIDDSESSGPVNGSPNPFAGMMG